MQPILGDPGELEQVSAAFLAGAEQFRTAHTKVKGVHDNVFPMWEGAASRAGERATRIAVGRAQYALDALHNTGQALHVFQLRIAGAIAQQSVAAAQINALLPQYSLQPTNTALLQEIKVQEQKALAAQQDAVTARRIVEAALVHSSTVQWYTPAGLDPITAVIVDSLVAHKLINPGNAQMIAGRLGKLSKKDQKKFAKLEATATSDKERARLFTGIAAGVSVAHLASADRYANPVAGAHLTFDAQHRIDQGVDYNGSGPIGALGSGIVTEVVKKDSGWDGAYVQYKLTSGPYNGHYVYYAEGVKPLVQVGDVLHPGQPVVQLNSSMEMGFAAGPGHQHQSWATVFGGGYGEGQRTAAGDAFNNLLKSTGAPGGQTLNRPIVGSAPTPPGQ